MSGGGVERKTPWPISVEAGDAAGDAEPKQKKKLDRGRVDDAYADLLGPEAAARVQVGKLNCPNGRKGAVKKGFLNSKKVRKEGTGMYDENGSGEGVQHEDAGEIGTSRDYRIFVCCCMSHCCCLLRHCWLLCQCWLLLCQCWLLLCQCCCLLCQCQLLLRYYIFLSVTCPTVR